MNPNYIWQSRAEGSEGINEHWALSSCLDEVTTARRSVTLISDRGRTAYEGERRFAWIASHDYRKSITQPMLSKWVGPCFQRFEHHSSQPTLLSVRNRGQPRANSIHLHFDLNLAAHPDNVPECIISLLRLLMHRCIYLDSADVADTLVVYPHMYPN